MKHTAALTVIGMAAFAAIACGSDNGGGPSEPEGSAGAGGESGMSGGGFGGMAGGGGEGALGSGGTAGAMPSGCTPSGDVDAPDEEFQDSNCDGIDGDAQAAVFVSPEGFDDALGTMEEPVQSLGRAIELATEDGRAVYACNGTYRENLNITTPVAIYGGYDCARGWRRIKDRAVVESGTGVPLSVVAVDGLVHIERMAFRALDGVTPGQSSQAGAVVDSTNVELVRVELTTGDGAAGQAGAPGTPGTDAPTAGARLCAAGADTSTARCDGAAPTTLCDRYASGGYNPDAEHRCMTGTFYVTRGGGGGRGGNTFRALDRLECMPNGSSDLGLAGSPGQYLDGTQWVDIPTAELGRPGADGEDGASAGLGVGDIEGGLYVASNSGTVGSDGDHGRPGRGGKGGDSTGGGPDICRTGFSPASGGGQGGTAGCAGTGAMAGGGGGGAIGLVIVNGVVRLSFPRFVIGDGGAGGDGALGGEGKPGMAPGAAGAAYSGSFMGQPGQAGGRGGDGGDGGAGGGGPSIAILYLGTAPAVSDAVYSLGLPGSGGLATSLGDAPPGVTGEVVNFEELLQ